MDLDEVISLGILQLVCAEDESASIVATSLSYWLLNSS